MEKKKRPISVKREDEEMILERGKAVEQVVNMPGWKEYIAPLFMGVRNAALANIDNVDIDNPMLKQIILVNKGASGALKGIIIRINEWINKKKRVLEIQEKREQKNK